MWIFIVYDWGSGNASEEQGVYQGNAAYLLIYSVKMLNIRWLLGYKLLSLTEPCIDWILNIFGSIC